MRRKRIVDSTVKGSVLLDTLKESGLKAVVGKVGYVAWSTENYSMYPAEEEPYIKIKVTGVDDEGCGSLMFNGTPVGGVGTIHFTACQFYDSLKAVKDKLAKDIAAEYRNTKLQWLHGEDNFSVTRRQTRLDEFIAEHVPDGWENKTLVEELEAREYVDFSKETMPAKIKIKSYELPKFQSIAMSLAFPEDDEE